MHSEDERNAVIQLYQNPPEVGVPSVDVHEVCVGPRRSHGIVALRGGKNGTQRRRTPKAGLIHPESTYLQIPLALFLPAEAPHLHLHQPRQRPRQVIHMHPGPAIHMRRILIGQQQRLHEKSLRHPARI